MSAAEPVDRPAAAPRRGRSMEYRKRRNPPMPCPEQSRRQNDVLQSAWRHFGDSVPVIAFLNTRHEALGALPLHLAIESDEGLQRVERLLGQMSLEA